MKTNVSANLELLKARGGVDVIELLRPLAVAEGKEAVESIDYRPRGK